MSSCVKQVQKWQLTCRRDASKIKFTLVRQRKMNALSAEMTQELFFFRNKNRFVHVIKRVKSSASVRVVANFSSVCRLRCAAAPPPRNQRAAAAARELTPPQRPLRFRDVPAVQAPFSSYWLLPDKSSSLQSSEFWDLRC